MKKLMIGIIVVFCSILVAAWIAAEHANPKMLDADSMPPVGKKAAEDGS